MWRMWQFKYLWNASVIWQSGTRFCYLFTYDNFFMVLSCIKNSWQYWRTLPDSVMTFLSQHIILWYCNMKRSKTSIWLICKNYNTLSIFTLFGLLLWNLFTFLKRALWFHFSENRSSILFECSSRLQSWSYNFHTMHQWPSSRCYICNITNYTDDTTLFCKCDLVSAGIILDTNALYVFFRGGVFTLEKL